MSGGCENWLAGAILASNLYVRWVEPIGAFRTRDGRLVNKVRMLEKETDRFEDPRDKRVTGESGSIANEPCDPVPVPGQYPEDGGRRSHAFFADHNFLPCRVRR